MNAKTHYDKMAESSTHFTLHETMTTTNQSRAVTDDSLQQKMSSRPSQGSHSAGGLSQHQRQQQYLVNENYDKSEAAKSTTKHQGQSKARNGQQSITKATVEHSSSIQCHKSTGAIPKQKAKLSKPSTNHLDEIVSLPLDDLNTTKAKTNGAQPTAVQ